MGSTRQLGWGQGLCLPRLLSPHSAIQEIKTELPGVGASCGGWAEGREPPLLASSTGSEGTDLTRVWFLSDGLWTGEMGPCESQFPLPKDPVLLEPELGHSLPKPRPVLSSWTFRPKPGYRYCLSQSEQKLPRKQLQLRLDEPGRRADLLKGLGNYN